MNEPLNNPNEIRFVGKTQNKHPHWSNEPLRLTTDEKDNPLIVLQDFFQCYHLHKARAILWEWLVQAVSSPNARAQDHHERNNDLYFYEKIEALIESTFILKNHAVILPGKQSQV